MEKYWLAIFGPSQCGFHSFGHDVWCLSWFHVVSTKWCGSSNFSSSCTPLKMWIFGTSNAQWFFMHRIITRSADFRLRISTGFKWNPSCMNIYNIISKLIERKANTLRRLIHSKCLSSGESQSNCEWLEERRTFQSIQFRMQLIKRYMFNVRVAACF